MIISKQSLKNYAAIGLLGLVLFNSACKPKTYTVQKIEGRQIAVDSTFQNDPAIEAYISPYRDQINTEMNTVLAYSPYNLTHERKEPETLLGNFMADLCFERANTVYKARTGKEIDFTLLNIGGLRADIPQGDVKVRNAFEVMPFENSLVVVELTYDKIQELLNYYVHSDAHPISKHLRLVIENSNVASALLNGKAFTSDRTYMVLTNDYLSNGGDNMTFFQNPISSMALDYKVRNALLDELKAIDTIQATLDERVIRK